jgi:hypothetical protein
MIGTTLRLRPPQGPLWCVLHTKLASLVLHGTRMARAKALQRVQARGALGTGVAIGW